MAGVSKNLILQVLSKGRLYARNEELPKITDVNIFVLHVYPSLQSLTRIQLCNLKIVGGNITSCSRGSCPIVSPWSALSLVFLPKFCCCTFFLASGDQLYIHIQVSNRIFLEMKNQACILARKGLGKSPRLRDGGLSLCVILNSHLIRCVNFPWPEM